MNDIFLSSALLFLPRPAGKYFSNDVAYRIIPIYYFREISSLSQHLKSI